MTNYNDGKWHGWNGGECPVHPETVVEFYAKGNSGTYEDKASHLYWSDKLTGVIAFRVVKEHREPREWWAVSNVLFHSLTAATEYRDFYRRGAEIKHVREVLE